MNQKKRCLLRILLILGGIVLLLFFGSFFIKEDGVKINKTNFPEELVRKVAIKADVNKNGILSKKEAGKVKTLYFKKLKSSDLADVLESSHLPVYTNDDFSFNFEGIPYFYNTENLTIDLADGEFFNKESEEKQQFVKTSNLDKIYQLKNLKKMNLHEVGLEKINIQKFPKLKRLNLHSMYQMKKLILPEHPNLNYIWISNNDLLEEIDLTNVSHLEQVHIRDNQNLQSLKMENNPNIQEINMMYLPKLQNINLSSCLDLKTLYIRKVPLIHLDVSKNIKLDRVGFFNLSMQTLDLTHNKKLTYLINDHDSFKEIILSDDNILAWLRWINSNTDQFPIPNLNLNTLIGLDIQGTKIKEIDISPYSNLETLYYDEELTTIIGDTTRVKSLVK